MAQCFFGTTLAQPLRAVGVDSLVVTCLNTSGCVRATMLDGSQHDHPVIVPREAIGEANASNLRDRQLRIASVKLFNPNLFGLFPGQVGPG